MNPAANTGRRTGISPANQSYRSMLLCRRDCPNPMVLIAHELRTESKTQARPRTLRRQGLKHEFRAERSSNLETSAHVSGDLRTEKQKQQQHHGSSHLRQSCGHNAPQGALRPVIDMERCSINGYPREQKWNRFKPRRKNRPSSPWQLRGSHMLPPLLRNAKQQQAIPKLADCRPRSASPHQPHGRSANYTMQACTPSVLAQNRHPDEP